MAHKRTNPASLDFGPKPRKTRKSSKAAYSPRLMDAIKRITEKKSYAPTEYQIAIFQWLLEETGHLVVNAVPGAGKTSTLEGCCIAVTDHARRPNILVSSFGKAIVEELQARITLPNVTARTFNSLGHGIICKYSRRPPAFNTEKTTLIIKGSAHYDTLNRDKQAEVDMMIPAIRRLTGLFKGYGLGAMRPMPTKEDADFFIDRHDIELPDPKYVSYSALLELLFKSYELNVENMNMIDYDDQLFIPIRHNMPFPSYYDYVMIDESQDMNPIKAEMVKRIIATRGRALFVGDRNQAIFGFAGADTEAMDNVIRDFKASELPLSICWRCPRVVVARAKEIVPHIEAAPTAIEGIEEDLEYDKFIGMVKDGDFIICRTCAPLSELCMELIRAGHKATIKGSDIGKRLCSLLDKIANGRGDSGEVWERIDAYGVREVEKLNKPGQENKTANLQDRIDTLKVLAEGCQSFKEVKDKISLIFSDNAKKGIILSTAHRAKGLEYDRIFIIRPELMPHPMAKKAWQREQEMNLLFVAITRSMAELYWVMTKPKRNGTTEERLLQK